MHTALGCFGAPLQDLTLEDLATTGTVFQIGVDPVRVDILTSLEGVEFDEAWPERVASSYADRFVNVICRTHFIQNKKAVGRHQDLADIEALEELKPE